MATATLPQAGYSGRTLPEKLGFKAGMDIAFVALPDALAGLADAADFASVRRTRDWGEPLGTPRAFDAIHAFTKRAAEIETGLPALQDAIRRDGMIWVSWPKKASKVPTDIGEDGLRGILLPTGLVDVKVAAIDATWSGLKFMFRKEIRPTL